MILTHSFVAAITPGWYRYVFYVLYGDYLDFERAYINEFRRNLERLGRNLGDEGAVIEPFQGDIDRTRNEVWHKEWTSREHEQLQDVPSLLVLTKSLAEFSPRSDPWLLLHFGEREYTRDPGYLNLHEASDAIARAVTGPEAEPDQLYKVARELATKNVNYSAAFQAKPGIWGFSVDLFEVAKVLQSRMRRPKGGRWPKRRQHD